MGRMLDKLRATSPSSAAAAPGGSGLVEHVAAPEYAQRRPTAREVASKGAVGRSPDLARILALARRPKPDLGPIGWTLNQRLRKVGGTMELREIQAWLLYEAPIVGGLIAQVNVGGGKTLPGLLMPMVMPNCRRAVLFIPAGLRAQLLERDLEHYGKHWELPNIAGGKFFVPGRPVLHIITYSELSNAKSTDLLEKAIDLDLIVCDEVQNLKAKSTARTKRVLRHFAKKPDTRLCGWSGNLTSSSIRDFAHLSAVALDHGSPLPLHDPTVEEWAAVLDAGTEKEGFFDGGELMRFCDPGESVRQGYRRRLTETWGVVSTAANKLGTSLNLFERKAPPMPDDLIKAMGMVRKSPKDGGWKRPDGEELTDHLSVNRCLRQLAHGAFLRWRFPHGEPAELIYDWFNKRQAWNRELRQRLEHARQHMDSPLLCTKAAIRWYEGGCKVCHRGPLEYHRGGCSEIEKHPVWAAQTWPAWSEIHKQVYHETEAVWFSDYLLRSAAEWAAEAPGIVWVEFVEFGRALAKATGMPYYGEGAAASAAILKETGNRSIIASVVAHGEGKNLQHAFWRNLIVAPAADAKLMEQVMGRTHREGQPRDEVEVYIFRHTPELHDAFEKAKERAKYIQEITGSEQKLCYASYDFK